MKLLLIEDDLMLIDGLHKALSNEGFIVKSATKGNQGFDLISVFKPDIVILDLGLPDVDGVNILKKIRLTQKDLPVLILTARSATQDKVTALDYGADDYLAKPFEMAELLARIRVLARRLGTSTTNEITIASVRLDIAAHTVAVSNLQQSFTNKEFLILKSLMENAGRIQTKDMIESKLYGWGEEIGSNTIEVHISNMRKKLPANFIKTVRGVGYSIDRQASVN